MPPTVSVIIPTFNRAFMLLEAIASVLQQTARPFEIIVVDDGSTDHTERALEPLGKFIHYIKTTNRGASAARNRGIQEAKGDLIAFLDSDDTWHPTKLEHQLRGMTDTGTRLCFCVSTDEFGNSMDDLDLMDPDLSCGETQTYQSNELRIFKHPRHPFVQSMLVEKHILEEAGSFDESLTVAEDTKLIYNLVLRNVYSVVNVPLVKISRNRARPGLSDSMDPKSAFQRYACYSRVQSDVYWKLLRIDRKTARIAKSNMRYFQSRQAELACALQQKKIAIRYAFASLSTHNGIKSIARNLLILIAYPVAVRVFSRKWNHQAVNLSNPEPPVAEPLQLQP